MKKAVKLDIVSSACHADLFCQAHKGRRHRLWPLPKGSREILGQPALSWGPEGLVGVCVWGGGPTRFGFFSGVVFEELCSSPHQRRRWRPQNQFLGGFAITPQKTPKPNNCRGGYGLWILQKGVQLNVAIALPPRGPHVSQEVAQRCRPSGTITARRALGGGGGGGGGLGRWVG